MSHPLLPYASGAVWHMQRGVEHYRSLVVEHASLFGNPTRVADFTAKTKFELAWAGSDLKRVAGEVTARDPHLGARVSAAIADADAAVAALERGTPGPDVPRSIEDAVRVARAAADLLKG